MYQVGISVGGVLLNGDPNVPRQAPDSDVTFIMWDSSAEEVVCNVEVLFKWSCIYPTPLQYFLNIAWCYLVVFNGM